MSIDHDQRRERIASLTVDLIAREGLGAATIRAIANEAGWSTAAITHYFADKRTLLHATFAFLSAVGEDEFAASAVHDRRGLTAALLTMVAWCPANVRRWRAYLAFWDQSARDPDLAAIIARSTGTGVRLIGEGLVAAGFVAPADAIDSAARFLNSVIQGISLQAIVAPQEWSPARVEAALTEAVGMALDARRPE